MIDLIDLIAILVVVGNIAWFSRLIYKRIKK